MRDRGLKLDPLEPFKEYMGCGQHSIPLTPGEGQRRVEHIHRARVDPNKLEAAADIKNRSAGIPICAFA